MHAVGVYNASLTRHSLSWRRTLCPQDSSHAYSTHSNSMCTGSVEFSGPGLPARKPLKAEWPCIVNLELPQSASTAFQANTPFYPTPVRSVAVDIAAEGSPQDRGSRLSSTEQSAQISTTAITRPGKRRTALLIRLQTTIVIQRQGILSERPGMKESMKMQGGSEQ